MSSTKDLFIFRHGETDWNAEQRFQGHIDVPLNARGRAQARFLVEPLRRQGIEAVLSSDLSRAFETGTIVAEALGVPIYRDGGLREAHLGAAQGLTRQEIEAQFGEDLALRWRSAHVSDADVSYPGGETGNQIMDRVFASLEKFALESRFSRIGVASHGGVIRRLMQRLLPPGSPMVPIPNGVLYHLVFDPAARHWEVRLWSRLDRPGPKA